MQPTLSLLSGKQLAIVGGGPVGLTLASILQQRGATVQVYERSADPLARPTGGSLDIHAEYGQRALAAANLLPRLRELAHPVGERLADQHGVVEIESLPDENTPFDRPEIDRGDLNEMLLSSLAPGTVSWGQNFQRLERRDGRFVLHFAGQPAQVADVVVGASGGRSKVRPYVTPAVPVYSGSIGIQGRLLQPAEACPAFYKLLNNCTLMVRAEGKTLFAYHNNDGTLYYYLTFRRPADWFAQQGLAPRPAAGVAQFLAGELAGWAPVYHELFRATTGFEFMTLYNLPLTPERPVTEPITLVGDAAHLMPPFAGIGVNIGLLDALLLADNLTSGEFASVEAAIASYERTMYDYAREAQEMSAAAELAIHSDMSNAALLAMRGPQPEPEPTEELAR